MKHDFFSVRSLAEVEQYLENFAPLPEEEVSLEASLEGRVLARAVYAQDDVPQASRSAMDGYALVAADTFGCSEGNPCYLDRVGNVAIERPAAFGVRSGQCAGIVTGGCLPAGADAVVMVEHTLDMGADCIEIRRPVPPGEHVLRRGEDARQGECVLEVGSVLRPQELGLLAAVGSVGCSVFSRPRVAIISTGDELVTPDTSPAAGQVRDVNTYTLAAMIRQAGAEAVCMGIVPDELQALRDRLHAALACADVVFLSGGSSIGIRDFTLAALQALPDMELFCHGVALSPGKPLILATAGGKSIWGLPGQVTSAQVVVRVLGQPFLRRLAGAAHVFDRTRWPQVQARLARNTSSRQGREDFVRVRLEAGSDVLPEALPIPGLSGLLRTLVQAHGLIHIPAACEGLEEGSMVRVLLFD